MSRNTKGRLAVTQDMVRALQKWQSKTGFGMTAIFRHAEINNLFKKTKSLNAPAFNNILAGKTKTVFPCDYTCVIEAYETLPPEAWGKHHGMSRRKERVPVTDEFKTRLQAFLDQSTLSRAMLLKLNGAPKDLTNIKLGLILSRPNTTMPKAHAEFLERLLGSGENR